MKHPFRLTTRSSRSVVIVVTLLSLTPVFWMGQKYDWESHDDPFSKVVKNIIIEKKKKLWLGVSLTSKDEETRHSNILDMYLASNSSKHAFQDTCPFQERVNCSVSYTFQKSDNILAWWRDAVQKLNENILVQNPLILWVSDTTILYPTYFYNMLEDLELHDSLWFAKTPYKECGHRYKPHRMICRKLSGSVVVISAQALNLTYSCWQDIDFATSRNVQDVLARCFISSNVPMWELPRQFSRIEQPIDFWNKLVEWNSLPVLSFDYITAKFGRDGQFLPAVEATWQAWIADGMNPRQLYAYTQYPDFILKDERWKPHLRFLTDESLKPKGGGYWFWKAPILLHHLNRIQNGAFVMLSDADLLDHGKWLQNLLVAMLQTGTSLALYQVEYPSRKYTKRDVYDYYCPGKDPTTDESLMYAGGWLVARKTQGVLRLVNEWQDGLSQYDYLLNDSPSHLPNISEFQYHLHDQSILSLLMQCRYTNATRNYIQFDGAKTLKNWQVHLFDI